MNIEEIELFLERQTVKAGQHVRIDFKKRDPIFGLFIKTNDFTDLKSKNFWRIVTATNMAEYQKTKNMNLARIFSGSDFSKLSVKDIVLKS
ncbi:hypothetical protein SAMN05444008_11178 [Cnuella takakiae]|uniref:Uncharacterized protein n=1 Tax=Cnuella takakiae TaxID=1302690 RepID=A0A1M5DTA5_9BACT|nr:short-chain dehydrogenase [Cnuella takakiae]OLY93873.1 short-chain dehydrogenase [Cnuella takakiae]SHF70233.1 hypothetical protein SAMN05444008_11178 [Cnuella takakiae]